MKRLIKKVLITGLAVILLAGAVVFVRLYNNNPMRSEGLKELSLFPSGRFLKLAAFGYDNFWADIYWIQSVQYLGEHLRTDRKFTLLYHIYDVITQLDPGFIDAYNFGAVILAQYSKNRPEAMNLLKLGMRRNSGKWQIPFQAGFLSFTVYKNVPQALGYFKMADKKPNAPIVVKKYIAFLTERSGNTDAAIKMWSSMYNATKSPLMRIISIYNILTLKVKKYKSVMNKAVSLFVKKTYRFPSELNSLVKEGYLKRIPVVVPWKPFQYDPVTGKIISPKITWGDANRYVSTVSGG